MRRLIHLLVITGCFSYGSGIFGELVRIDGPLGGSYRSGAFALRQAEEVDFTGIAKDYLHQYYALEPDLYDFRIIRQLEDGSGTHVIFQMEIGGLPIVNTGVAFHFNADEVILINGTLVVNREQITQLGAFGVLTDTEERYRQAETLFEENYHLTLPETFKPQIGFFVAPDRLILGATFDIARAMQSGDNPLVSVLDGKILRGPFRIVIDLEKKEVLKEESLAFHVGGGLQQRLGVTKTNSSGFVVGNGNAYRINKVISGLPEPVDLENLVGNGLLHGKYLRVHSAGAHKDLIVKAKDGKKDFRFSTSDPRFDNVSVYYYGNRTLAWFDKTWEIPLYEVITYHVHDEEEPGVPMNNAYYDPLDKSVHIGQGDGEILQHLARDFDVVAHETAHHVIYTYGGVHSLRGESGAIHEGTADYVAFALTGDPNLAESVPVVGEYLRTADNELTYPPQPRSDVHTQGNIWSGTLWQLRNAVEPDQRPAIDEIVLRGLAFLNPEAVFLDYANGLLLADEAYADGKYRCTIANILSARGFHFTTENVSLSDCNSIINKRVIINSRAYPTVLREQKAAWDEEDKDEEEAAFEEDGYKMRLLPLGCAINPHRAGSNWWIVISLLMFSAAQWFRRRQRQ